MFKSLIPLYLVVFSYCTLSQNVNEKVIADLSSLDNVESYSLNFDSVSGTYLYSQYDTLSKKSIVYSNKGNTVAYDNIDYYDAIFDPEGNYFVIAYNNATDTSFTYFILKNGKEVATLDNMNTSWSSKNSSIYFVCHQDSSSYLAVFDMASGSISKGKLYDDIILCYNPFPGEEEGEPEVGFTKDAKPYYIAKKNDERFLVIGNEEQKHYSDIDAYVFALDGDGVPVYSAKSTGQFTDAGNAFIVQGSKEYKAYDYIYGPLLFDKSNNPIYISADSGNDFTSQRVVIGDKEEKTYRGGVSNLTMSPSGKLAYSGSEYKDKGADLYSTAVINGTEGKKYQSISMLKFAENDELIYLAMKDEETACIVRGGKETLSEFPTILDANISPGGKLTYVCAQYGNYEKKIKDIFYLYIGEDELGPYDGISPINGANNRYFMFDKTGNYAYLTTRMVNLKDYSTDQRLYTNKGKSEEFDYIDNVNLYKGKALFVGTHNPPPNSKNTNSIVRVYYDNKPVTPEYSMITSFTLNEATGTASFITMKNKSVYKVEVKL